MKLNGSDNRISPQIGAVVVASVLIVFVILGIVLVPQLVNKKNNNVDYSGVMPASSVLNKDENEVSQNSGSDYISGISEPTGVTSPGELDFWDLYPENKEKPAEIEKVPGSNNSDDKNKEGDENTDSDDPSKDGKHTKVVNRDGTEEWVTISQYLPKNDYDYSNLVLKDDRMEYYVDGKKTSYIGIDISKYQDYIDFNKVKKDGIAFVMIRVGVRGYGDGQITFDDYFFDNIKRATDAGLKVGVYFSSQAITKDEALEEAKLVVDSLADYKIDYPIAFEMSFKNNDTARVEVLSPAEKTDMAKTFLDYVSSKGYTGCVLADKEWLIKEIDLSKITSYDFWLKQEEDLPDYPYKFSMWQYKTKASVDGITGFVDLNISFVDYTEK
jgi:GH25 family lysozyme M1 (1,4-beta-N-acetylmuramidase)